MSQTSLKTAAIATALAFATVTSAHYSLVDDYTKEKFFPGFDFFTGPDPTSGFVQYQTLEQSIANQYIGYLNNSIYIGADYTNKTPQGRPSVRVEGKKAYNQGLLVADVLHMPDSTCGSWPALWMFADPWPSMGEIDIVEGVSDQRSNIMTLHTSAGCAVDNASAPLNGGGNVNNNEASFLGHMLTKNCDVGAPGQDKNVGCGIEAPSSIAPPASQRRDTNATAHSGSLPSYGTDFNQAGGGVYAMQWTDKFIAVYFFSHAANETIPKDLLSGNPDPSGWGTPLARFGGDGCDFTKRFKDLKIVINLTFCGQWAGDIWTTGGCAAKTKSATCEAYVENNPDAFSEAYWEIASLKWFEDKDGQ
ncbi:hypothetical protein BU16DRAFT_601746 [Lophium mytilinum]|uniref:endo-1,3(4)-beta-glucanase n=1 Tax=Lophium mytilinum TaxID=390894 RepID=A0A6A6R5S2_9PEZI|nr:hypothetical protein BU16DRAFT_601746 [Lophium mytilinum]